MDPTRAANLDGRRRRLRYRGSRWPRACPLELLLAIHDWLLVCARRLLGKCRALRVTRGRGSAELFDAAVHVPDLRRLLSAAEFHSDIGAACRAPFCCTGNVRRVHVRIWNRLCNLGTTYPGKE